MASIPDPAGEEGSAAGEVRVGDYEVGRVLRQGWAGTIREGRHVPTGQRVTVETLRPDLSANPVVIDGLARVGREVATLREAHLLGVYDAVEDASGHHLVAEWTDAPTLDSRPRKARLDTDGVAALLQGVLAGLAALHRSGSFHGRVGMDTVVTEPDGTARLAELAICAAAAPDGSGPSTDVAQAARLGLQLLPDRGDGVEAVRRPLVAALTTGSGDAAALREALRGGTGPAEVRPRPPSPPARTATRPRGRRRLLLAAIALVAVTGGIIAGLLLSATRPPPNRSHGALVIGADATLSVSPTTAGCNTTFVFVARGSLSGTGSLVYRWEQSDGQASAATALSVRADEGSFQLTQAWRLQGSQTVDGSMTLHILAPVERRLRQAFRYGCP